MSTLKKFRNSKGFTLIELLVVIAIIGVLATLILLQLGVARAKARDAKRIADTNQLRTAIELFFDDQSGSYPGNTLCAGVTGCAIQNVNFDGNDLTDYMSARVLPKDPLTTDPYKYAWDPASGRKTKYHIWTDLERKNAPALTGDTDINSISWGGGNKIDALNATVTENCSSTSTAADCVYDLGQQ